MLTWLRAAFLKPMATDMYTYRLLKFNDILHIYSSKRWTSLSYHTSHLLSGLWNCELRTGSSECCCNKICYTSQARKETSNKDWSPFWYELWLSSQRLSVELMMMLETICFALTLTGWKKFLSKFYSSPQILTRCQHQNQTPPSPPPTVYSGFGILTDLDSASKIGTLPPPPPYSGFGILAYLDSASKVGTLFPPFPPLTMHIVGFYQIWIMWRLIFNRTVNILVLIFEDQLWAKLIKDKTFRTFWNESHYWGPKF